MEACWKLNIFTHWESVVWGEDCCPMTEDHNISAPHPKNLKCKGYKIQSEINRNLNYKQDQCLRMLRAWAWLTGLRKLMTDWRTESILNICIRKNPPMLCYLSFFLQRYSLHHVWQERAVENLQYCHNIKCVEGGSDSVMVFITLVSIDKHRAQCCHCVECNLM